MKVLMFGWEFPPHISGGLGTACSDIENDAVSSVIRKLLPAELNFPIAILLFNDYAARLLHFAVINLGKLVCLLQIILINI